MGLGDMLSKVFGKESEKMERKLAQETPNTKPLVQNGGVIVEEKINDAVQIAESEQKKELINQEKVETKQETKSEDSAFVVERVTEEHVLQALSDVYDPEIPIDIVNLGLVYGIDIKDDGEVLVRMTMTSPGCPSSGQIAAESQMLIEGIRGVKEATIEIVFDPPWDPSRMSEDAKKGLGYL
jgi:FeS assembly SUF system protein